MDSPKYANTDSPYRQPKLKETCDRCSVAKVRCSRDKPACTRCISKGIVCEYSHSRRAGRRTGTKRSKTVNSVDSSNASSPSPSSPEQITSTLSPASPMDISQESPDSLDADNLYNLWSFQPSPTDPTGSFSLDSAFYSDPSGLPTQNFGLPQPTSNPHYQPFISPLQAVNPMDAHQSMPPPFALAPEPTAPVTTATVAPTKQNLPPAPHMDRSPTSYSESTDSNSSANTINSNQVDSVHDELISLTDFADAMEHKFDTVVRQRLQHRLVSSEFGMPVDDLESTILEDACDGIMMPGGGGGGLGGNGSSGRNGPDLSELSFYYSLAELRRRLKWLKEDVGQMISQPQQPQRTAIRV